MSGTESPDVMFPSAMSLTWFGKPEPWCSRVVEIGDCPAVKGGVAGPEPFRYVRTWISPPKLPTATRSGLPSPFTSEKATSWKSPDATWIRVNAGLAGSNPDGPGVFTRTSSPPAVPLALDQPDELVPQCAMSAKPSPFTSATASPVLD